MNTLYNLIDRQHELAKPRPEGIKERNGPELGEALSVLKRISEKQEEKPVENKAPKFYIF